MSSRSSTEAGGRGAAPPRRVKLTGVGVYENLEEMIGDTPLVRLAATTGRGCPIYLKLEFCNPGGTVKDRTAFALIRAAERSGKLRPGGVIVEPTSGNTGLGLAWIAARRGYRCIFTLTDKVSTEKIKLLEAYGAEVVICPSTVSPDDPTSYYSVARDIAASLPSAYSPDQYANPANHEFHCETTGPELWRQTDGRITHFVAGAGTGGTISGVGRYLKQRDPGIQVICADPVGSIYSNPDSHGYLTEGIGEDFFPANFQREHIDEIQRVSDAEAFAACYQLTKREGLIVGGSGGMAVAVALRVAATAPSDSLLVALIPDSGRGYLSKLYAREWMLEHGFESESEGCSIRALLKTWEPPPGEIIAVPANVPIGEAVDLMRELSIAALPVGTRRRPVVISEVMGSVSLRRCWSALNNGEVTVDDRVGDIALPPIPVVGTGEAVTTALERVGFADPVLVVDQGRPVTLLSSQELLSRSIALAGTANGDGYKDESH